MYIVKPQFKPWLDKTYIVTLTVGQELTKKLAEMSIL